MGVESATFIQDFDSSLPTAVDLRSQGDDHLRLLKSVLKGTFPTATKAWYNPNISGKTANFTVVAADMNKIFMCDTSAGAVTMTLPVLAAGDAGWTCSFWKYTSDANPVFVAPPSGTLNSGVLAGITKARRALSGILITIFWSGTIFNVSRALSVPIGTLLDFAIAGLPAGYEYPNGQTLASASTNYQEYYSANGNSGVTLDLRGRLGVPLDDLGGSAAGRWAGGIITATAIGNTGGTDTVTLSISQMPSHTHGGVTGAMSANASHTHGVTGGIYGGTVSSTSANVATSTPTGASLIVISPTNTDHTHSISSQGGGALHSNVQPSIIVNKLLVVE